jgi:hypothetical protein
VVVAAAEDKLLVRLVNVPAYGLFLLEIEGRALHRNNIPAGGQAIFVVFQEAAAFTVRCGPAQCRRRRG